VTKRMTLALAICLPVVAQLGPLAGQVAPLAMLNDAVNLLWEVAELASNRRVVTIFLRRNGLIYKTRTITERRAPCVYNSHVHRSYTRRRWDLGPCT
jgi:hypothetical protein